MPCGQKAYLTVTLKKIRQVSKYAAYGDLCCATNAAATRYLSITALKKKLNDRLKEIRRQRLNYKNKRGNAKLHLRHYRCLAENEASINQLLAMHIV